MNDAAHPPPARDDSAALEDERRIGVLLVDDHAVVREGLRRILTQRADMVIVGEAANGDEALALVSRRRPDVVVMNLTMPGMDGLEATRRICSGFAAVRVVMLTARASADTLREAHASGALGVVFKDSSANAIADAIAQVADGQTYIDPRMASEPLGAALPEKPHVLSTREQQILQLLADGCTNPEVCERLLLGSETVKTHVSHILTKLHATHRSQAVAIGLREGIIR